MPRGGKREGAGRPSAWKHKETKLVRVPVAIADRLLDIAYKLDRGETLDFVTESKTTAALVTVDQMTVWDIPSEDVQEATKSSPSVADGKRWLTTKQAFERAESRGCKRNVNGFKGWSQRNPEKCLEKYGLRRLDHRGNNQKAPGYEDVLFDSVTDSISRLA